ncbi:hypothetical protein AOLI_G00158680 [Acnodon oligacanthus]
MPTKQCRDEPDRQELDQARYNGQAKLAPLLPGERVLIRNFCRRAKGKLNWKWATAICGGQAVARRPDSQVPDRPRSTAIDQSDVLPPPIWWLLRLSANQQPIVNMV